MATQEKEAGMAARKMPPTQDTKAEDGQGSKQNGEVDEHTKLGHVLGRAGTAVGDSLTGLTRRGDGDASGGDADADEGVKASGEAPKAVAVAALSAAATVAGRRLLERPRRRVAGIPVPGTRRPRKGVVKDLARHLPGVG